MADSFGLKIGLEGEKEFKKALADINQSFKVLGSEMKLATSQFDKNDILGDATPHQRHRSGDAAEVQRLHFCRFRGRDAEKQRGLCAVSVQENQ